MKELTYDVLNDIAQEYGQSFYILDTECFQNNYNNLLSEFRKIYPNTHIAYSYKTNYVPELCKIVNALGGYAEVVSDMEYEIARRVGVPNERVVFNGPYKKPAAVEEIFLSGGLVNIDSDFDLAIVRKLASKYPDKNLSVGIRCNFDVGDGVISRFGFDISSESFCTALAYLKSAPNISLCALHIHFANRRLDVWEKRVSGILDLLDTHFVDVPPRIDLGGGLFGNMEDSLKAQFDSYIPSFEEYAHTVASAFAERFINSVNPPMLFIEPGSALAGDAMKFVAKVVGIKNIRSKNIATLLGSMYNINPTLNKKNPPIAVFHGKNGAPQKEYRNLDFGGFTCIESDYLYRGYDGLLAEGDYVVFNNVGSYSVVLKPPFILPNFSIIELQNDGTVKLIKRPETFDDLFRTYTF